MAKEQIQVEVEQSVYQVLGAVAKLLADVKAAIKAGGGAGPELASIVTAAVGDLAPVLGQVPSLASDAESDNAGAFMALAAQSNALVVAIKS